MRPFSLRRSHCVLSRSRQAPQPTAAPTAKPEEGIPITDATVQKACGSLPSPDDKGQMSRISFQRNTPEGWQDDHPAHGGAQRAEHRAGDGARRS